MNHNTAAILFFAMLTLLPAGVAGTASDDIDEHRSCAFCGMDRKAYGFSRMLVQYEDGSSVGVCSLHCAVIELDANKERNVKALLVADRNSRTLLDAEKAVWVMGGKKPGVMTQRPKWAFVSSAFAAAFIDAHGGKIVPWSDALAAARQDAGLKQR